MQTLESNSSNGGIHRKEWHALYIRHQHEKAVAQSLSKDGFEIFLPVYSVIRKWKDRSKQLSLPLFPCYVFFQGGLDRRLKIISTPGVFSIVTTAGKPASVPEMEIEAIRLAVNSTLPVEPHPFLKCGDRVRVKSGPLTGVEGILLRRKSSYRLILSTELLEKSIAVEVDAFSVERIPPRTAARPEPAMRIDSSMYGRLAG